MVSFHARHYLVAHMTVHAIDMWAVTNVILTLTKNRNKKMSFQKSSKCRDGWMDVQADNV